LICLKLLGFYWILHIILLIFKYFTWSKANYGLTSIFFWHFLLSLGLRSTTTLSDIYHLKLMCYNTTKPTIYKYTKYHIRNTSVLNDDYLAVLLLEVGHRLRDVPALLGPVSGRKNKSGRSKIWGRLWTRPWLTALLNNLGVSCP